MKPVEPGLSEQAVDQREDVLVLEPDRGDARAVIVRPVGACATEDPAARRRPASVMTPVALDYPGALEGSP
jgi:hypothetical protein